MRIFSIFIPVQASKISNLYALDSKSGKKRSKLKFVFATKQVYYVTDFISPEDSLRFGFNIAKVNEVGNFRKKDFLPLLKKQGVQLIISRVNSAHIDDLNFLEDIGFRIKDMQLTYKFDLDRQKINPGIAYPDIVVREASPVDIPSLCVISEQSFDNYGHYFADQRLDKRRCREIYSDWTRRSVLDTEVADKVFVAEYQQQGGVDVRPHPRQPVDDANRRKIQVRALTRPVGQELSDRILGDRILHGFLLRSAETGAGVRCAHAGSVVSKSSCINA